MGRTPSNQGMAGLHPVSQVSFRLSQVPPSRHRKARMYIDRAESIEDDESIDGLLAEISNDEYNDMVRSDKDCRLDMEPSTPLTISSPMLSLSSMTSTAHISTPLSRDLPLPRNSDHSQRRVPLLNVSTNIPEQQPRKSILSPQFQHKSPETTDFGSNLCRHLRTKDAHTLSESPMRSVSVYRRSLANLSPDFTQNMHPLLSQRPNVVHQNGDYNNTQVLSHNQQQQQQQQITQYPNVPATYTPQTTRHLLNPNSDTIPTKRHRKQGVLVTELQTVVSCARSGYNIWWHRMNGDSATSLASRRPSACMRAYISNIEMVVSPHLYSASGTVYKVFSSDLTPLEPGQSFTALLSLSVCATASPQTAEHIARLLISPDDIQPEAVSSRDSVISARQPRAVDIYQPIRITKTGSDISILASRFLFL